MGGDQHVLIHNPEGAMDQTIRIANRFILNNQWFFDMEADQIRDVSNAQSRVALSPIASRLLSRLVLTPNTVLRRQHLIDECWRHFGFEVGENSLSQAIHSLKSVFAQLPEARPIIVTMPRFGYCFMARVSMVSATIESDLASSIKIGSVDLMVVNAE